MKKVIFIGEEPKGEKGVEFTHCLCDGDGWGVANYNPYEFDKIIYLGRCKVDGDMFACYKVDVISIYKGHLNNGTY